MNSADPCPACPTPGEPAPRKTGRTVPLTALRADEHGVIERHTLAEADAKLLAAMGLCCNARVRLCRVGQPCIVAVMSGRGAECRIGLARPLAERILVDVVQN
ncbi:MAG: ferrous iron transport protein A [Phycisphaerales bacterium]